MKTLLLMTLPAALVPAAFSFFALGQAPATAHRSLPIGYVSGLRIQNESTAAKALVTRLRSEQQQRSTGLKMEQQALDATRQQLENSSAADRTKLQQQEQQQRTTLEQDTARAQTDLQTLQRQLQAELQPRVASIVGDLAKTQDIQLVLNGDATVVWAAPGLDLTNAVIAKLNEAAPAGTAPQDKSKP